MLKLKILHFFSLALGTTFIPGNPDDINSLSSNWGITEPFSIKDSYTDYCLVLAKNKKSLVQGSCDKKPWHIYGDSPETRSLHYGTAGFVVIDSAKTGTIQVGDQFINGIYMDHSKFTLQRSPASSSSDGRYILVFDDANFNCLAIFGKATTTYAIYSDRHCYDFTIQT